MSSISNLVQFPSTKVFPYVYRGDNPVTGEFYFGSRIKNFTKLNQFSSNDLGNIYKTSSDYLMDRFSEFNWTIIAEFFNSDNCFNDAYEFEHFLINENWENPLLLNKSNFDGVGKFRHITPHSEKSKQKMSVSGKGRKFYTDGITEVKVFPENCPSGFYPGILPRKPQTDDHKKKCAIAQTGKQKFNDGITTIMVFPHLAPDGWVKGIPKEQIEKLRIIKSGFKNYTDGINQTQCLPENCPEGWWNGVPKFSESHRNKLRDAVKGKVRMKDKYGNNILCHRDDPRIKTGELVGISTGMVACFDLHLNKYDCVTTELFKKYKTVRYVGTTSKLIPPDFKKENHP